MSAIEFSAAGGVGPMVVIVGPRGAGKTMLVRDLLHFHQDVPYGTIVAARFGAEAADSPYAGMAPKSCIFHEYESALVENLLRRQQHVMKPAADNDAPGGAPDGRALLVLDDCLYDSSWPRDNILRNVFMNGRCWKIMCIITLQYPNPIPPIMQSNIDFTFLLFESSKSARIRMYENYASVFPSFKVFNAVFAQTIAKYECMVLCNNGTTSPSELTDIVKFYRAVEHPSYRLMAATAAWAESESESDFEFVEASPDHSS